MLVAMEDPKLKDTEIVLLSIGLVQNSAIGARGKIST